jgi:signal transduction histidine kinase
MIKRIDLGEAFTEFMVSSICKLDDNNLLFTNSYGLFRLNIKNNEYWVYDENMGLPSNTITDHGILVDSKNRIWIGSSNGVAYTHKSLLMDSKQTPTPYCINARVNGKSMLFSHGIRAPFGSFINLVFSSISFPENKVNLQWKINDVGNSWKDLKSHELNFSDLAAGQYQILTRAKKNAGLSWSEPASLVITIDKPFWMQTSFFLLIILLIGIIIWLSYLVIARIMNKRREYLQNLVKSRTKDLELANEELSHRNAELDRFVYSASHDLAAPLKSLLGLINITKMEDSRLKVNKYLVMMEGSIKKLDEFIKEVISYSRNTRIEIKYDPIDFKELIHSILDDHEYSPNFNLIRFEVYDNLNERMITDVSRLKIILNNLVSNSIKFHRVGEEIIPKVLISLDKIDSNYIIIVEDNGRGIPTQHLDSIFEMFFRGTVDVQGSGLGLYILKETVVKLHGTIEVNSDQGKGAKFSIMIPIPKV